MVWLDQEAGVDGAVLCYSSRSPLLLTGRKQVSRWYASQTDKLLDADDQFTRFVKQDTEQTSANASLPPFQFHVEQHPTAELEVREATHPWRLAIALKGRSGPPLYESAWQTGAGKLTVDVLKLYRQKSYTHHFPELQFFVTTRTEDPHDQATVVFRLRLKGHDAIITSLPIIRTRARADREGIPIYAVILDHRARRLGKDAVEVTASVGKVSIALSEVANRLFRGTLRDLPVGEHRATLRAVWKENHQKQVASHLDIHITDEPFLRYDRKLRLLTENGQPIGPVTGSYHGGAMFKNLGAAEESLVQGQAEWEAARDAGTLGIHRWESFTERELDADFAYLACCGWSVFHLSAGWAERERLDAGGRIAPHGAEQLALLCAAARRNGLHLLFALSHYELGGYTPPYAQYLEAGYRPQDYQQPKSKFYQMFTRYLAHFATIFRDEPGIFAFSAAGEGDLKCGKTFVNTVYDFFQVHDGNHLFVCEPHHAFIKRPDFYQRAGWKPVLGGMRTYHIDRHPPEAIGVQFKISAMSDVFMAEGLAWGWGSFKDAASNPDHYRQENRRTFYTGLAYHNPIVMTWQERVVENEQIVFEQVRKLVDWSKPFARPRLAIRVAAPLFKPAGAGRRVLYDYEKRLAAIPLEYAYVWKDEPVPPGTLATIDARQPFSEPTFASDGGALPEQLKADMFLRLPADFAANYSWSQDRRTLLAFLRQTKRATGSSAQHASGFVLQNFPAEKLRFRLYDLDTKKVVQEGTFENRRTLKIPKEGHDFFLLINDR